jgi:hypothetical protein
MTLLVSRLFIAAAFLPIVTLLSGCRKDIHEAKALPTAVYASVAS